MINVYKLLKLNRAIKSHRVKFLALFLLHKFNSRYLAVNLDPVLACNLRCKMCYFTDSEYVKKLKGQLKDQELELIAKTIFKRALKLQIGCGTEPTLYKNLEKIIDLGKQYKVPYISLTTNANLLDEEKIEVLINSGLNEFTISLHGVTKNTYEYFMKGGNYEKFQNTFKVFEKLKSKYDFKVRINYTFNKDNFLELEKLFDYFNGKSFDILQIRPIRDIGNTEYNDFNLEPIKNDYEKVLETISEKCEMFGITLLASGDIFDKSLINDSSLIFDYTFCYVSPNQLWKKEFDWKNESFNEFSRRIGWGKTLFRNAFKSKTQLSSKANRLNYEIDFN